MDLDQLREWARKTDEDPWRQGLELTQRQGLELLYSIETAIKDAVHAVKVETQTTENVGPLAVRPDQAKAALWSRVEQEVAARVPQTVVLPPGFADDGSLSILSKRIDAIEADHQLAYKNGRMAHESKDKMIESLRQRVEQMEKRNEGQRDVRHRLAALEDNQVKDLDSHIAGILGRLSALESGKRGETAGYMEQNYVQPPQVIGGPPRGW